MIYLDNAATTFPKPEEVYAAVDDCQRHFAVNVGRGSYMLAGQAAKIVDETRRMMARLVNAESSDQVIFTPSATIAANEVILGLEWDRFRTVYVSPFEHNAIARPLYRICKENDIVIREIPFDPVTQEWDEGETSRLFAAAPPDYLFLNQVSNVTGTILPIDKMTELAKKYGACVVVDGSQSVGLLNVDMERCPMDYLIFAGHKNLYASWGVGGFVKNTTIPLKPVIVGGTGSDSLTLEMPWDKTASFEAGSANIIAISSLYASLKWLFDTGIDSIADRKDKLMKYLIDGLENLPVNLYLPKNRNRHTSVLSLNIPGYLSGEVGMVLNGDFDIAVRTGFHCAPYIHKFLGTEEGLGTVRVSIGFFNTKEDMDALLHAISEL